VHDRSSGFIDCQSDGLRVSTFGSLPISWSEEEIKMQKLRGSHDSEKSMLREGGPSPDCWTERLEYF
jgi:hypothetical protein